MPTVHETPNGIRLVFWSADETMRSGAFESHTIHMQGSPRSDNDADERMSQDVPGVAVKLHCYDSDMWDIEVSMQPAETYATQQEARAAIREWFKHWATNEIPILAVYNHGPVDKYITVDGSVPGG